MLSDELLQVLMAAMLECIHRAKITSIYNIGKKIMEKNL